MSNNNRKSENSKKTNKIKSEQLGMPFGTAYNKLRKSIMFMLVEKANLNKCFRCGKPMTVDNISIEHMENWLHSENPIELFFDINNISFSHHKCNVGSARQPESKQKSIHNGKIELKGVSYYEGSKKPYRACITIKGKNTWIGSFETAEEAGKAYDKKAIEIFGENTKTNKSLGLLD